MRAVDAAGLMLVCAAAINAAFAQPRAESKPVHKPELNQSGKDVVWVPTPDALVKRMLDLAKVGAGDYVVDLGSGDGRLVIMAAKRGARALGIEYDARLADYARRAAVEAGVAGRTQFLNADLFASDFSQATVVTLFLGPDLNRKLLPKLLGLKPGTRVVSNTHPIGDWPADETVESADDEKSVYYRVARLWIVPSKAGGEWRWPEGRLALTQRYQAISGSLSAQGKTALLTAAALRGDRIRFTAGSAQYAGTVAGDAIVGTVSAGGVQHEWRAVRAP